MTKTTRIYRTRTRRTTIVRQVTVTSTAINRRLLGAPRRQLGSGISVGSLEPEGEIINSKQSNDDEGKGKDNEEGARLRSRAGGERSRQGQRSEIRRLEPRHGLCPACPAGSNVANNYNNYRGRNYGYNVRGCCPARKTVFRTRKITISKVIKVTSTRRTTVTVTVR